MGKLDIKNKWEIEHIIYYYTIKECKFIFVIVKVFVHYFDALNNHPMLCLRNSRVARTLKYACGVLHCSRIPADYHWGLLSLEVLLTNGKRLRVGNGKSAWRSTQRQHNLWRIKRYGDCVIIANIKTIKPHIESITLVLTPFSLSIIQLRDFWNGSTTFACT